MTPADANSMTTWAMTVAQHNIAKTIIWISTTTMTIPQAIAIVTAVTAEADAETSTEARTGAIAPAIIEKLPAILL
jgi:hypothetical protein